MTREFIVLVMLLITIWNESAFAEGYSYRLQIADCSPAAPPNGEDGKPDARWVPYVKFVQACPVFDANHHVVLNVLTIRTDLMEKAKLPDNISDNVQQQILDAKGNYLGSVIGTFPLSDPSNVKLTFTDWRRNFPWKIVANFSDDVGLDGPSATIQYTFGIRNPIITPDPRANNVASYRRIDD